MAGRGQKRLGEAGGEAGAHSAVAADDAQSQSRQPKLTLHGADVIMHDEQGDDFTKKLDKLATLREEANSVKAELAAQQREANAQIAVAAVGYQIPASGSTAAANQLYF